jgi:hypothetical protein
MRCVVSGIRRSMGRGDAGNRAELESSAIPHGSVRSWEAFRIRPMEADDGIVRVAHDDHVAGRVASTTKLCNALRAFDPTALTMQHQPRGDRAWGDTPRSQPLSNQDFGVAPQFNGRKVQRVFCHLPSAGAVGLRWLDLAQTSPVVHLVGRQFGDDVCTGRSKKI